MLRDLAFDVWCRELHVLFKCCDEMLHIAESTHGTEAAACLVQRGTDPAQHHFAVAPAFHVARVMCDESVEILDWIGRSERFVECTVDAQRREGERLHKALAEARSSARMRLGERVGQSLELSLR